MKPQKEITLSVCIIAKNEEKNLTDCFRSVVGVADEIVLVDTGSQDRTYEIARNFGAKVIDSPWQNDFSQARNVALEAARMSHILSIDADERLENPEILKSEIARSPENTGGWLIDVVSDSVRPDGSVDSFSSSLLRLFVNRPEIRFSGIIHEQIIEPILALGMKLEKSDLRIRHIGYSHSPEEMRRKQLRNLELLNVAIDNDPKDAYSLYQRAKTYLALKDLEDAEKDTVAALEIVAPESATTPQALNFGAIVSYRRKEYQTAIERAKRSLELVENQAFANFILGETYVELKNFKKALHHYTAMRKAASFADFKARIVGDYNLPEHSERFKVGKCLVALGKFDRARVEFEAGIKAKPDDPACFVGIANVEFRTENYEMALEYLRKAQKTAPKRKDIAEFIRQTEEKIRSTKSAKTSIPKSGEKPLLTLSMIVKNEEKDLPGCLESAIDYVDEIVVADTGSTDSTKEIARKFGAKVYDFKWIDDFAAARNEALKRSNGEWILYLDADERLDRDTARNLRETIATAPYEVGAFVCLIESEHAALDGKSETHRGGYPRIFRNLGYPKIEFRGRVHEQITPSLFDNGKSMRRSEIKIIHLGYNKSREEMEKKVRRNYKMLIRHVKDEPLNSYAWYQLGQTLTRMGLMKESESAIRFAIEIGDLSDSVFASAAASLAHLCGLKKKYDEAVKWADESIKRAPDQLYAWHIKAYATLYLNRPKEALELFEEVRSRAFGERNSAPESGFDVDIPLEAIKKGIEKAKKALDI